MKESWLDVQLCKQESEGCHASNDTVLPGVLKFPKGSNEDTVSGALLAYELFTAQIFTLVKKISVVVIVVT